MTEFVKLKTDSYERITKGRYYKVLEEYFDPIDKEWCYLVRRDDMKDNGYYPQIDFEKPITHVKCIDNEDCSDVLTICKLYEIKNINYVGGELITLKKDNGQTGQFSSKRFEFVEKSDSMTEFVKLKTDSYKALTKGRYYEVHEEYLDQTDNVWCYMIRLDNMIDCGFYPQKDFEKPVTHVKCTNNEGSANVLTASKIYEIISINYIGGELVTLKNDAGQTGQYSSKRFEFVEKGDSLNYTHAICKDNEMVEHKLTYDGIYEIVESNNSMIKIVDDSDEYSWYAIARFELVSKDTQDISCKREEPKIMLGGTGEKLLKPLRHDFYHITYSLQYAEGAELEDISKTNIIQIEGKIVSKGRTWVIETAKGTVIIPFKSIIHMHPQY